MSDARVLYEVQLIELDILERAKRVKAIAAEMADDQDLRAATKAHAASEAKVNEYQKRMAELERQIETVSAKRKATETRLYSGSVSAPKEMQDMQLEIDSLTRRRDELDDDLLMLMLERDEAEDKSAEDKEALDTIKRRLKLRDAALSRERKKLSDEINELRAARKDTVTGVSDAAFRVYNDMRAAKANRPVAELRDKTCAACGIRQHQSIVASLNSGDGLVMCGSCGRILCRAAPSFRR